MINTMIELTLKTNEQEKNIIIKIVIIVIIYYHRSCHPASQYIVSLIASFPKSLLGQIVISA